MRSLCRLQLVVVMVAFVLTGAQVYHDPNEPIVDPTTGQILTSRPTAFGRYLNTKFLNVAAKHNGGKAKAVYNQDSTYHVDKSIDGITTGHEGWAYHGRLDKAIAMFELKEEYRVSRIRVLSGVGRFTDHHATAFQIWYTNHTSYMMPPAVHWFPHYYWQPIADMQPTTLDTVIIGNRVYTNGEEEIVLKFSPIRARAVLLKIDGADSDASNCVLTEFEVFTADPDEPSAPLPTFVPDFVDYSWVAPPPKGLSWKAAETAGAIGGSAQQLLLPAPDTDVVPYRLWSERNSVGGNKTRVKLPATYNLASRDLGFDAAGEMRKLCNGRWFTPLHPKVPFMQQHLKNAKAGRWCEKSCGETVIAVDGQDVHINPNTTCKAIAGSEFLFIGDTRIRQFFLAAIAYFRGVNLRGYSNPSHPHFYGQQNSDHWFPPGRQESCGTSMPHGFELECAGVVGNVATLCDGSVILRLEETDDRQKLIKRLGHWMEVRKACEENKNCPNDKLFVVANLPIPKIRSFSSAQPIRPAVPMLNITEYLKEVMSPLDSVWRAAAEHNDWFHNGIAASMRTSLIWTTNEPYAITEPRHAPHNRNITQLNAEIRQQFDQVGIPILDGFRIATDRFECHPDNVHWCSVVHNTKVGILLTFARQLVEKLDAEMELMQSKEEIAAIAERAKNTANELQIAEEAEEKKAMEEEVKRKKAADEARARKKAEEEEAKRKKKEQIAEKMAKFEAAKKKKKPATKKTASEEQCTSKEECASPPKEEEKCSADGTCKGSFEVSGSESFSGKDSLGPGEIL